MAVGRARKSKKRSTPSKKHSRHPTTFKAGHIAGAPQPYFAQPPTQREQDLQRDNNWWSRSALTINNKYTPTPLRIHEVGKGLVGWDSRR